MYVCMYPKNCKILGFSAFRCMYLHPSIWDLWEILVLFCVFDSQQESGDWLAMYVFSLYVYNSTVCILVHLLVGLVLVFSVQNDKSSIHTYSHTYILLVSAINAIHLGV